MISAKEAKEKAKENRLKLFQQFRINMENNIKTSIEYGHTSTTIEIHKLSNPNKKIVLDELKELGYKVQVQNDLGMNLEEELIMSYFASQLFVSWE